MLIIHCTSEKLATNRDYFQKDKKKHLMKLHENSVYCLKMFIKMNNYFNSADFIVNNLLSSR